ncbi:MAG: hypothetical protein WDM81_08475 [Rhizomicrobium sp.]
MAAFLGNLRNVVIAGFVLALGALLVRVSFGGLDFGTEASGPSSSAGPTSSAA